MFPNRGSSISAAAAGCIGCALGVNLPKARVIFADISPEALSVTRKNISLHRLNPRAVALEADALAPPPLRMQNFDLIACNPPYITEEECQALDASVRDWEPMLALDGGEDGLVFYRSVLQNWKSVLKDGGWIIFEVEEGRRRMCARASRGRIPQSRLHARHARHRARHLRTEKETDSYRF